MEEGHGRTILTATTTIIVLTVLLIGGLTSTMLEALEVIGENSNVGETADEENEYLAPAFMTNSDGSPSQNLKMRFRQLQQSTTSFTAFDKNILTPFFTPSNGQTGRF
ncbi:hypothetical protein KP509_01G128700 [Ceratopteris richardii]|uniref:Uncharacterized protein n=1 Tax=Ceratopteris richardii TaxID=49495 RepID=A0A8T2VU76_CERRI|nr:hypothetical protein KP509_01G128700 [Ceratopteris richardii]